MTTIEQAKAVLERLRLAANAGAGGNAEDVEVLLAYLQESERVRNVLPVIVDLLAQSRNAFRSKTIERARKLLEELL